jgi:hypothetical protein
VPTALMERAVAPAAARGRPVGGRRPLPGFEAHQGPPARQQKCVNPCTLYFCGFSVQVGCRAARHAGAQCLRRPHRRAPRAVLVALPLGTLHPTVSGLSRPPRMCERKTPPRAAARAAQICCVPTARGVGSVGAGFVNRHYRFSHSHPCKPCVCPSHRRSGTP